MDFIVKGSDAIAPILYLEFKMESIVYTQKKSLNGKPKIEKQEENKKLYPAARKAFIDGPANIRDKPKGKTPTSEAGHTKTT
jgi:hypothetical protein